VAKTPEQLRREAEAKRNARKSIKKAGQGHTQQNKKTTHPQSLALPTLRQSASKIWRAVGAFAVVFGIVTGWIAVRSDVEVQPSFSLNPEDPFTTEFTLTNSGPQNIYNVEITCEMPYVVGRQNNVLWDNVLSDTGALPVLEPKEKQNVSCYWGVRNRSQNPNHEPQYTKATLKVKVAWRPSYWPSMRHSASCFKGEVDYSGIMHWAHIACSGLRK
jgi:hypothetical protein